MKKRNLYRFLGIFLTSAILAACGSGNTAVEKNVRGTLIIGHEVRSFSEEGSSKDYWVSDETGLLMTEYRKAIGSEIVTGKPVTAELRVKIAKKMEDGFAADYDGTYKVMEIISIMPFQADILGKWVEPVPGMPSMQQGFLLKENGEAESIGMATLLYKKWKRSNDKLILSGISLGNHQNIDFSDIYQINELTNNRLILKKDGNIYTFNRQQ